jgi:hypothetical protein
MSATVDQFCDKLRNRLNTIEGQFQTFKADVHSRSETAEKAVRGKLDEARAKLRAQAGRGDQIRADLKARAQQKIAETKEAVNVWKVRRETRQLRVRADRAEAYAADAVEYALATIDEAHEAILDAVVARIDADKAEKPG